MHDQWKSEDIKNNVQELTYREKVTPAKVLPSDLIIVTITRRQEYNLSRKVPVFADVKKIRLAVKWKVKVHVLPVHVGNDVVFLLRKFISIIKCNRI